MNVTLPIKCQIEYHRSDRMSGLMSRDHLKEVCYQKKRQNDIVQYCTVLEGGFHKWGTPKWLVEGSIYCEMFSGIVLLIVTCNGQY